MTDDSMRDRAIRLYDDFTHEHRDRRTLLRQMTALAGSTVAAEALMAGIAASPAAAAIVAPDDKRLRLLKQRFTVAPGVQLIGYFASPNTAGRRPAVIVVHENRGLTPHIEDVARRLALAGFDVVAPDFLTPQGGTPTDEDRARELIAQADYDAVIAAAVATIGYMAKGARGTPRKVGIVGFCWGGALVDRVALAAGARLGAGVSYYGPAPAPEEAAKVRTPLMLHYAGKDARVAQTAEPWVAALKAAGKPVEAFTYPGVDHAFNNDTSPQRYDKAAADLAWGRTTAFLHRHLDR